jgi:hypothetical protein
MFNSRFRLMSAKGRTEQRRDTDGVLLGTYSCVWSEPVHMTAIADNNSDIVQTEWVRDPMNPTQGFILSTDGSSVREQVGLTQCNLAVMQTTFRINFVITTTPTQDGAAVGTLPSVYIPSLPYIETPVSVSAAAL